MKKIFNYILALGMTSCIFTACVDDINVGNAFLEKAPGVEVNIDTVFNKAEYTRNFLWSAYGQLYCTYTSGNMMNGAPIDVLSDSYHCYVGWGGPIQSYYPGNLTENAQDTEDGNFQGKFSYSTKSGLDSDAGGRVSIYETVRKCWQIIENIERVPDMSDTEKSRLRGEAYTIMASRYFDAFRNFGGLCLVKKAYEVGETFTEGRSTAWQTVEFIDSLIQCAINEPGYIWNIPNADIGQWSGRLPTPRNLLVWRVRSTSGLVRKILPCGAAVCSIAMSSSMTMLPMATITNWYSQSLKTKPATAWLTAAPTAIVTMRHDTRSCLMHIPHSPCQMVAGVGAGVVLPSTVCVRVVPFPPTS